MNRTRFIFFILGIAVIGFLLGRSLPDLRSYSPLINEESGDIPVFPSPPAFTPPVVSSPLIQQGEDIILETPIPNAIVSSTFLDITGRVRLSKEGKTIVQIMFLDNEGDSLFVAEAEARPFEEKGEFGRFGKTIELRGKNTISGEVTVRVSLQHVKNTFVDRSITITPPGKIAVSVFYSHRKKAGDDDCGLVFPVVRFVESQSAMSGALRALLDGPTKEEKEDGYLSSLPDKVKLRNVENKDGIVTADFSSELRRSAGACAVTAIRAQITKTLLQFSEVREVFITVNGEDEDVLEP